jgi:hypothetical protein
LPRWGRHSKFALTGKTDFPNGRFWREAAVHGHLRS